MLALGVLLFPLAGQAAKISASGATLRIAGTIMTGDADKVRALMGPGIERVVVKSGGGNAEEGIAIGELLLGRDVQVVVDSFCMSACANYIFTSGRHRTVLSNSVLCFHGGTPQTEADIRQFIAFLAESTTHAAPILRRDVDLLLQSQAANVSAAAQREVALLGNAHVDEALLGNSRIRMIPRNLVQRAPMSTQTYLRRMEVAWCPSPQMLKRYGVDTENMWYPVTEESLYRLGRSKARNLVLVAYSQADLPPSATGHYVATGPFDSGIGSEIDLADIYNNLGAAATAAQRYDQALADYDVSIKLKPNSPWPHNNRGVVYAKRGQFAEAIQSYGEALRLQPADPSTLNNRAATYTADGQYELALADYDALRRFRPESAALFADRGRVAFYLARYRAAAADLSKSLSLDPSQAYVVLWLHLARLRAGQVDADELVENARRIDQSVWPAPIVSFMKGQHDAAAAMKAAEAADPKVAGEQRCEADFYIGEDALIRGQVDEARRRLGRAQDTCPIAFVEFQGAEAELKQLQK